MPAPPLRAGVSGTPSRATANTAFGALWDYVTGLLGATGNAPEARTALGAAASGAATASGITMATARVLGRTTAATGAIEEISIGSNLTLVGGVLSAADGTPPGVVTAFARNTAPSGWLKANGALVSRTTYAVLFSAIGTTFGAGDGSTTFALPDMRGEFPRGWDDSRGVDSGRAFGSAQAGAIESHTHSGVIAPATAFGFGSGGSVYTVGDAGSSAATGGAETRPRNIALLYCIKF